MKVAICIPCYGDTKADFTISLARLVARSLAAPGTPATPRLEIETFLATSSDLVANRTNLLQRAMAWQARYLLWLDADHIFPPDALLRLIARRLPVVGCNYPRRTQPTGPVASRIDAGGRWEHVWTTEAKAKADAVEEVAVLGLGLCLVDMLVFRDVQAHVEKGVGWENWAPFDRKRLPGTNARMGEDASFFQELREAGVKIYVDHALSWQVGHIGERVLTNADAEKERAAFANRPG
ncbi:MAG: hypothetical protein JO013_15775 [Alphaproteobacteria bacterium]|nr:hypothetical protein [Alphaproteobacteria bacterium]